MQVCETDCTRTNTIHLVGISGNSDKQKKKINNKRIT